MKAKIPNSTYDNLFSEFYTRLYSYTVQLEVKTINLNFRPYKLRQILKHEYPQVD